MDHSGHRSSIFQPLKWLTRIEKIQLWKCIQISFLSSWVYDEMNIQHSRWEDANNFANFLTFTGLSDILPSLISLYPFPIDSSFLNHFQMCSFSLTIFVLFWYIFFNTNLSLRVRKVRVKLHLQASQTIINGHLHTDLCPRVIDSCFINFILILIII